MLTVTKNSLTSLQEILSEPYSPIIRDAAILRFNRSVEIFSRLLKDYLCVHEGLVCDLPKSCMRMAFKVGLMDEEETVQALEMIDQREEIGNITEHVNFEEVAEEIYRRIGDYWVLMDKVCRRVVEAVEEEG
ncbi:TPA: nucleotidyltransferase [Methanosarcinaceae archaeon]|nr:nucleotidyltransferase [Methanosarcinaceae archaeon]